MRKLIEWLVTPVYIAYLKKEDRIEVSLIKTKQKEIIEREEKTFINEEEFVEFIRKLALEYSYIYVSTLVREEEQGLIDSCKAERYAELHIDLSLIKRICLNDFSIYISIDAFKRAKKEHEKCQPDYLFSPFSVIEQLKKKTENTLYLLAGKSAIALQVYEKDKPIYGRLHHYRDEEINEEDEDEINLSDIDEFDDIDTIEDISDGIEDSIEDEANMISTESSENLQEEVNLVTNDLEAIEFIKNALREYYDLFGNDFIETIIVLEYTKVNKSFLDFLEKEFFVQVEKREINLLETLNLTAMRESDV